MQKIKGTFSVKTRFTDVLVGQTFAVSALASLYSCDPMILCVATAYSFVTIVSIAAARDSLMTALLQLSHHCVNC